MHATPTKTFRHRLFSRRPLIFFFLPALAALLCFADLAEAQRRGGRGHGRSSFSRGGRGHSFNRGFGRRNIGRRHFGHRRSGNRRFSNRGFRRFGNRGFRRFNRSGQRRFNRGGCRNFNRSGHRRFNRGGIRQNFGRGFQRHHNRRHYNGHRYRRNHSKFCFPRRQGFSSHRGYGHYKYGKPFRSFGVGFGGSVGYVAPYPVYREYPINNVYVGGPPVVIDARQLEPSLEIGRELIRNREYDRAADALLQVVRADTEAGLPKLLFGHALAAAGDYGYAAYAIRRALIRIDLDTVMPGMKDLYHDAQEFDRLLYALHHHARKNPSDPDAHMLLGYFRYFGGRHNEAIESLNQALRYDPGNHQAQLLREHALSKERANSPMREIEPKRVYPPAADSSTLE